MKQSEIKKALKRAQRQYKKEKKLCAKLYPDWKDNEYNMGFNHFIWGLPYYPDREPLASFNTANKAMIYYNRYHQVYYLDIDTKYYTIETKEELQDLIQFLDEIDTVLSREFCGTKDIIPFSDFTMGTLEGKTRGELYSKWKILYQGYKNYYIEKALD